MNVLVLNHQGRPILRRFTEDCLQWFAAALRRRGHRGPWNQQQLVVVFLDKSQARVLNRQYRKKDYATDVLSFSGIEPESLGELVLSMEVIRQHAREHRLTVREELSYLLLHGLLHLLGYEHESSPTQARRMFQLQDALWNLYWRGR